ncbi:hypothetical protein ACHAPT_002157 [Fusarium lateritium]
MSHQRRSSTSQTYQGHSRRSQQSRSVAGSAPASGITYTPGSVRPDDFYDGADPRVYTQEPDAFQDPYSSSLRTGISNSYRDQRQYAGQDRRSTGSYPGVAYNRGGTYAGGNAYSRGGSFNARNYSRSAYGGGNYPRGGYYGSGTYARGDTYTGRDNRPSSYNPDGRWTRDSYPQQRFPADHYDALGNYIGAPPESTYSSTSGFISFPRFPEPEVPPSPSPPPRAPSPPPQNNRRSLSVQLVDGVRNLFSPEPASSEPQIPPQPPRTGVYLFCRHRNDGNCTCITPLEDNEPGDYCQRCWEGRCDGERPPGSTPKRSLW